MKGFLSRIKEKRFFVILVVSALIVASTLLGTGISAYAKSSVEEETYIYYTSIELEAGDTLWGIAERYTDGNSKACKNYIKEICRLNHISSEDSIHEGQHLLVYYASSELK